MSITLELSTLSEEEQQAYQALCNHGLDLNDFLDRLTPETSHRETDWGPAVGEEVLNDLYCNTHERTSTK